LSIRCDGELFKTVCLLSEMHIQVYNAQHINSKAGLLFVGRWRGYFRRTNQQQESQVIRSFEELLLYACSVMAFYIHVLVYKAVPLA